MLCSVLQCIAVFCSVLQCIAVCCSVLQCVAVCCSVIQRLDTSCTNVPAARNCVDTYQVECSMLQCVAVCCSVFETCQVPQNGGDHTSHFRISKSTRFLGRSFEWRGLYLVLWKLVWNLGDSRENVFDMYGDSRGNFLEILVLIIIWSLISSVRGNAVCCGVLRCVAVCCNVMQCVAVCCGVLRCVAVWCSRLRCVAVWYSV